MAETPRAWGAWLALLGLLGLLGAPSVHAGADAPWARIAEIEIRNEGRTTPATIRAMARVEEGDTFVTADVEVIRRRLLAAGLFSEVVVFHEPLSLRGDIRIVIAVREKLSWVVAPTFAFSSSNVGGGLIYAENNLWGENKKFIAGGLLTTGESGVFVGFLDPLVFGLPELRWSGELMYRNERVEEYYPNASQKTPEVLRATRLQQGGFATEVGVTWLERFRTNVKYRFSWVDAFWPELAVDGLGPPTSPGPSRVDAAVRFSAGLDTRQNLHAIMEGVNIEGSVELASPLVGSDFAYRKVGILYRHGIRFLDEGNLILRAEGILGKDLPFHAEVTSGGTNLRGYLYRQFRGDTKAAVTTELHQGLFRVKFLSVRGLLFYDGTLSLYRYIPPSRERFDVDGRLSRSYLPEQANGVRQGQWAHGIGAGIRLYVSNIVLPLLGVDGAFAPNSGEWRVYLVAGVSPG